MRSAVIISIAVAMLVLSPHVLSQGKSLTDFDPIAAEKTLREGPRHFSKSLHEFERYPDGAKGFGAPNPEAYRVALPSPPPPPFATELEWETYNDYCGTDAIVLAVHLDSTPILTDDKRLIYAMSHFSIVDIIKSDGPLNPGQRLVAYRLGGTVEDAGETLRGSAHDCREQRYGASDAGEVCVVHGSGGFSIGDRVQRNKRTLCQSSKTAGLPVTGSIRLLQPLTYVMAPFLRSPLDADNAPGDSLPIVVAE